MEEPKHNEHRGPLGVGNTSDAIVESQSTQLLDFVLGRAEPCRTESNNAQPRSSDDTSLSADHSSKGSDTSFPSASAPSYHFHGLASTQSPAQLLDSEGSQKENEHAYIQAGLSPSAIALATRDARSRHSDCVQVASKCPLTPSRVLSTKPLSPRAPPQPTKTVAILSSTRQTSHQKEPTKASTMRFRRRPSPPIPSQDSFAGLPPSQDPDLFIATTRQFGIPIDQLGRSNSQERSAVESSARKSSVTSSVHAEDKAAMVDYSLSSSSSGGKILVANSDSSGPSQDSQKNNNFYSISQEPTQLNSDASDAGRSEHEDDDMNAADQVVDASTRAEPTQTRSQSQEETQVLEESLSVEIGPTSAPGASVVSDKLSLLSLVPPEKRAKYMHHFTQKKDERAEPTPGPSTVIDATEPTPSEPSPTVEKRSLLSALPQEKLSRYMHHIQRNSVPVSDASRMATAGTSLGSHAGTSYAGTFKSPMPPTIEEEVVEDSEQQIEMDISPIKKVTSRDQEVIPPSESDTVDNSREEEEDEVEAGLRTTQGSPKKTLRSSAKGKQKAEPLTSAKLPCNPASSGRGKASTVGSAMKMNPSTSAGRTPVGRQGALASPFSLKSSATRMNIAVNPPASVQAEDVEMAPPPIPEHRVRGRIRATPKYTPPVATTSAATMHRNTRPPTPVAPPVSSIESGQSSPAIPLARVVGRRMEEEETEVDDAEEMVLEDEDEGEKPPSRRAGQRANKRKRKNAALTTKKASKGKAPTPRKVSTRATSLAPPSKKARTSASIAKKFGAGIGTQVFALFKSDSSFYGAEVHSLNGTRAHVNFFDGLEDPSLGVAQMRKLELRNGDIIIPGSKPYKAKVIDDSLWAAENEVNVEYTEGPEEGLEFAVSADALRIPARIIQSQWKDRTLEPSDIVPAVPRKTLKDAPSPSKNSVINTAPSRIVRNKLLSKYGIIITQGPGNQNWSREKGKYINIVKDNGGTVLSDWLDVFSLHGKHSNGNKRWTIQHIDVKYVPKDKHSFDRVFLVSDVHNQKPKYLLALALGIPCVSVEWLDHLAAGEELSWSRFLLAAGHSEPLGAPISQMVDLDWGSTAEHLTEIMENNVSLKVLYGTSVLCVGLDLFPHPAKKCMTDADRSLEASRTVPRIILAMGAERVEAVADPKHASEELSQYDYVVVKECIPHPRVRDATYVDVTWIKECLIAGRLIPVPEWV